MEYNDGDSSIPNCCLSFSLLYLSSGSDSVYLCSSPQEVTAAFERIHGQFNGLGQVGVL